MRNASYFRPLALMATLALLTFAAQAQVAVHGAWVRAAVPQQKATGAFMRLTATQDMRLVSVTTPVAGVSEIHEMKLEGQVMKMRAVPALELPAGQAIELKPGGYHVMLMDLKQPVSAGSSIALTLELEGRDGKRHTVQVDAPVQALGSTLAPGAGHGAAAGMHH